MKQKIDVLITDLDNTLFDWMEVWYRSFSAMLKKVATISGIAPHVLEGEIKAVHERHGTSEYAFLIEELPSLQQLHPGKDLTQVYAEAIADFRAARREALASALYPGVIETLGRIRTTGCLLVGYTESLEFYSIYRMRHLGLDQLLGYLYFPPDHEMPNGKKREAIRFYGAENYVMRVTQPRTTPKGELKPNPKLLLHILADVGGTSESAIYVGDKLVKDVSMAQAAGVTDVWAKYGEPQHRPEYELLRRVTHWTREAVEKERNTTSAHVVPKFVLENSFGELLDLFDFTLFRRGAVLEPAHSRQSIT